MDLADAYPNSDISVGAMTAIAVGNNTPAWILWVARVFPIRPFALTMQAAFLGTPFNWTNVLVVAAWGIAGVVLAIRFFTWEPRQG